MDTLKCCLHKESSEAAIIITGKNPTTISHSELADNVTQLQRQLQEKGVSGGKRIAIVLSNPCLFTVIFLTTTLQACVAGPLNHNSKIPEFEFFYGDFKADIVVLSEDDVAKSSPAYTAAKNLGLPVATASVKDGKVVIDLSEIHFESQEDATLDSNTNALVLHTSGTTGKPKAVPLTHGNLSTSIRNIRHHYQFQTTDRTSIIMPLFHIHGLVCALLTPLAVGAAVILPGTGSGITPSFIRDATEHGITWFTATPTLHRLVLKLPGTVQNLRFVRSCSSPLDTGLLKQIEEKFGCVVVEAYAMTEAAHQVCSNPVSSSRKEGSVGLPTGVEVKTLGEDNKETSTGQVGEVCIKGPNVMHGYIDNEEANTKSFTDTWFRTGDQGKLDTDGFLTLTGRLKELINKGGEKIGPVEIDAVVNKHPNVSEAVTFAIPDDMYGEEVAIAVVLENEKNLTEKELKSWIGDRLAPQKVPKKVFFVESIPKTAVGKMQRSLVAKTMMESS